MQAKLWHWDGDGCVSPISTRAAAGGAAHGHRCKSPWHLIILAQDSTQCALERQAAFAVIEATDVRSCHVRAMRVGSPPRSAGPMGRSWAPVAQLDRAPDYESGGWEFESLRARQRNHSSTISAGPASPRRRPSRGRKKTAPGKPAPGATPAIPRGGERDRGNSDLASAPLAIRRRRPVSPGSRAAAPAPRAGWARR